MHVYKVRLRNDKRGAALIFDALPVGAPWYIEPDAISYAHEELRHRELPLSSG